MNIKLRERVEKLRAATMAAANAEVVGVQRYAAVPALSAFWPTATVIPQTPTPTPTPSGTGATPLPTSTPGPTLTPTPAPIVFVYDVMLDGLVGEAHEEYFLGFPPAGPDNPGERDRMYIREKEPINQPKGMTININGSFRTRVDFDDSRTGTQFGYSRNGFAGVIEFLGTFIADGEINFVG